MNSQENLKITGKLNIAVTDETGVLKDTREIDNLVVTSGLTYIVSRMASASDTAMSHMAVGTGATAAAAGNTTLGTETARVALSSTTPGTTNIVYSASFGAGVGTGALTEAGIFNASSAGTLLCRTVFSVINKAANDTMSITWTVTLAAV
jgi:hypothetical protein